MESTRLYQSLDGPWHLVQDPDDMGWTRQWYVPGTMALDMAQSVALPGQVGRWAPGFTGPVWLVHSFAAEAEWAGRHVELEFDAVTAPADVWVNGHAVAAHPGGNTPLTIDVSPQIVAGPNVIAVRVADSQESHGVARPQGPARYIGRAQFAVLPAARITSVQIQPDLRRSRLVAIIKSSVPGAVTLRIAGTAHTVTGEPGRLSLPFPEFEAWSPDTPALYTLECEFETGGHIADCLTLPVGMREFTVADNRFVLNGKPVFVKAGALFLDCLDAAALGPPHTLLARAKQAGFNAIDFACGPPPREWLDACDTLGLLAFARPRLNVPASAVDAYEQCERDVEGAVLRDRNRPCVVAWVFGDESGAPPGTHILDAPGCLEKLVATARTLDPSRLIVAGLGRAPLTRQSTWYSRPHRDEQLDCDAAAVDLPAPIRLDAEQYGLNSGHSGMLSCIAGFGAAGLEDIPASLAEPGECGGRAALEAFLAAAEHGFTDRGLARAFDSFAGFCSATQEIQRASIQRQVDMLRSNPKIAGYSYRHLADRGGTVYTGLFDRLGRPKGAWKAIAEAQAPLRPVIMMARTNLRLREDVSVTVTVVNDLRLEDRCDLSLQVVGPTNQVLWKKKRSVRLARSGQDVWEGTISASGSPGPHRFVVRIMHGFKAIGESSLEFHVLPATEPCDVEIHVVDPHNEYRGRCLAFARRGKLGAPIHVVPPLANTIRAYPAADLADVFGQVREGSVALIFGPPSDWNELAQRVEGLPTATPRPRAHTAAGFHYVKLHPLFDGLPSRTLMGRAYRHIAPLWSLEEPSEEDICGTFEPTAFTPDGGAGLWGSTVIIRRYGAGRLVFIHLRVLENLGFDPVADRLFVNILRHFVRRSVPSEAVEPPVLEARNWIEQYGQDQARLWMVIGPFSHWDSTGHDTEYAPERSIDFRGEYPGWFSPVRWTRWWSLDADGHEIDLGEALAPSVSTGDGCGWSTAYAYAEIMSDKRQPAYLRLGAQGALKVWLNGLQVHDSQNHPPAGQWDLHTVDVPLKHGRNTVLLKISKRPGPFGISFNVESATREPLRVKWWK